MINSASRSRNLLASCVAAAGLAIAASPALADVYELQYQTASQSGDIFFIAPPPSALPPSPGATPQLIQQIVPYGAVIAGINGGNPMYSTETTTGIACGTGGPGCFNNVNTPQAVTGAIQHRASIGSEIEIGDAVGEHFRLVFLE